MSDLDRIVSKRIELFLEEIESLQKQIEALQEGQSEKKSEVPRQRLNSYLSNLFP